MVKSTAMDIHGQSLDSMPTMQSEGAELRQCEQGRSRCSLAAMCPDGGVPAVLGRIDQYELVRKLGGGGFGVVYLARDMVSGVEYAIKTLHPVLKVNAEEMERVRANFALTAKLSHPNIAAAHVLHRAMDAQYVDESAKRELRVFGGDPVMVMTYAPGVTLSSWRCQFAGGKVPFDKALDICSQIASALDYAHGEHIVHRDVKPQNVMIETDSVTGNIRARVLDFGLAAEIRSSMSRVSQEGGNTSGTRPYMAPEQWIGEHQDGRTDQYALACIAYELLSGAVPFAGAFETGDAVIMSNAVKNEPPKPIDGLPANVNSALAKALSKDRAQRFANCGEFIRAIRNQQPSLVSWRRFRKTALWIAAALAAIAAVVIPVIVLHGNRPDGSDVVWEALDSVAGDQKAFRPGNEDDGSLQPVATISAKVGGVVVSGARLMLGGKEYNLPKKLRLETGKEYEGVVDFAAGGRKYEGKIAFTADWSGERDKVVVLSELEIHAVGATKMVTVKGVQFDLVWVTPGSFDMGSNDGDADSDEMPICRVTLTKGYWMGKTEVTQGQWKAVMGDNPSNFKGDDLPVERVSWDECQEFIRKLNGLQGDVRFALPTEAQWEFAARGGTKGKGYKYSGSDNAGEVAWYYGNSGGKTHSVGTKVANELGIHDMSGNVWEWCQDCYGNYPDGSVEDPSGAMSGDLHVNRGGSWNYAVEGCRSTDRFRYIRDGRSIGLGLRLAASAGQ